MTPQRASHVRHKILPLNGLHRTKIRAMAMEMEMEKANPDARAISRMVDNSLMAVGVSSSKILSAVVVKGPDEAAPNEIKASRLDPMVLPLLLPDQGQFLLHRSLPLLN